MNLLLFHGEDFDFLDTRHQRQISGAVPFLPCGVIRFNLRRPRIVLADFLGRQIDALAVEHLQLVFGISNAYVNEVGVKRLDLLQERLALELLVLDGKHMLLVNLTLFDNLATVAELTALVQNLFLGTDTLALFVVKEIT